MTFEGGPTAPPPRAAAPRVPARSESAPVARAAQVPQAKAAVATAAPASPVSPVAPAVAPAAPAVAPVAAFTPAAVAAAPLQPASTPVGEPATSSPAPAVVARVKKSVSVVPADWDEQLSKPAAKPQPPQPVVAQPAAVPAVAKPMRSLEEVRADLARLRANAKERHTPVPVKRDTHFEPTDFQDFVVPEPRPAPDSYAPTAYMGFTVLKPIPGTPQDGDRNG